MGADTLCIAGIKNFIHYSLGNMNLVENCWFCSARNENDFENLIIDEQIHACEYFSLGYLVHIG